MDRPLNRRSFLTAAGAAFAVTACGGNIASREDLAEVAGPDADESGFAAARFSAPHTVVADGTTQRMPFGLADQNGPLPVAEVPQRVVVAITQNGELVVPREDIVVRGDGLVFPYYALKAAFDEPGIYDVELSWAGGGAVTTLIQVFDANESPLLQPGTPMPPVDTPTLSDGRGVTPICTRAVPCDFHEITFAEALTVGLPTVLVVSTPGFCQTAVCGPMLDLAIADHTARANAYSLVHAEVYVDPQQLPDTDTTEIMVATGMTEAGYEPAIFVIGADGVLAERLDNICDASELAEAVDRIVS